MKQIAIRSIPDRPDPPRKGFSAIPNQLLADRLGTAAVNVYAVLAMHADAKGNAWPSTTTIARLVRLSKDRVRVVLRLLERRKWIRSIPHKGGVTVYHIRRALATGSTPANRVSLPQGHEQEPL
jgi:hypothetical protein